MRQPAERLPAAEAYVPYDARRLSYARTFSDPHKAAVIRTLEWLTGKAALLRRIRRFEADGVIAGQPFWDGALAAMGIAVTTPAAQVARIPSTGPLVLVANHPHGLVDGIIIAALLGRVRTDYQILVRSLLTGVPEVARFLIPVPFPHEADAFAASLRMREAALARLRAGGAIALFPAGSVAAARPWWGRAVEAPWAPFTVSLIRRTGATVIPMYFPGQNSRGYQIAARTSATWRQGLLLHEVVHALDRPQSPVIGAPITPDEMAPWLDRPGAMAGWLRSRTLALGA